MYIFVNLGLENCGLNTDEVDALARLSMKLAIFKGLPMKMNEFAGELKQWLEHSTPEMSVPPLWDSETPVSPISQSMLRLLLVQAVRPDRVIAASHQLVDAIMGEGFVAAGEREVELGTMVETEVKASTPILLCSVPGFDASVRVDDLAKKLRRQITSIAFGSIKEVNSAFNQIKLAADYGRWVMLKNIHLAPPIWLAELDKRLQSLYYTDEQYRLFFTTEIHPKVFNFFIVTSLFSIQFSNSLLS